MKKLLLILGLLVMVIAVPVKAVDYSTPNLDNSWQGLPVCSEAKPKAPILYEPGNPAIQKAKNPGEVRLQWTKVPQASGGYNVYFGLTPRNYIYSATNIGDTDNYTVRFLGNRTYYFAVQSRGSCAIGPLSNEWAARPGGGGTSFVSNAFVPVQKKAVVEDTQTTEVQQNNVQPQAPRLVPPVPVAPKPRAVAAPSQGFFQSIFSFFGRLFGGK